MGGFVVVVGAAFSRDSPGGRFLSRPGGRSHSNKEAQQLVEAAFSLWERLSPAMKYPKEVTVDQPHSHSLRKGRQSLIGQYYLLTTATAERSPVFADFRAARCCIGAMGYQQQIARVTSLAFVVMPDHFHWLIELKRDSLAKVMQSVKGYTARRVNEISGRSGFLWQEGYHDRTLRADEDLRRTARYIVANPLRAGLVERVWDYPHWDAVWVV